MSIHNPKQAIFAQFAAVAKALGNPQRLELVEHLAQGPRSVEALSAKAGLPIANTSQHLQTLRRAGLVLAEREGKFVIYRLGDKSVLQLLTALRTVAEISLAEVDRIVRSYFKDRDSLEPVSRGELLRRMHDGTVTVLDVRPADEFALGHIPGAVNVPLGELGRLMADLDPAREVVAYCRGAYCVMSFEAAAALRSRGFDVRRLEDGMPEWKAAGLPVEVGAVAVRKPSRSAPVERPR